MEERAEEMNLFSILVTIGVVSGFIWFMFNDYLCIKGRRIVFWYFSILFILIIITAIIRL